MSARGAGANQPPVVVDSNPATLMHNKKPHTLAGTGLICCSRALQGDRTQIDSDIDFCGIKTVTLIYQCFYFAKTAKNAILGSLPLRSGDNSNKWRFNAWFRRFSITLNRVYFVPDARKTGGSFAEVCRRIKKLVPHESLIIMEDGTKIKVEDVVDVRQSATK